MNEENVRRQIALGRSFITKFEGNDGDGGDYVSDQERGLPQPPLAKAPMCAAAIDLPTDFERLSIDNDFLHIINSRRSHRVYSQEPITALKLSYLLWCSQGVQSIRGKAYATLRTVPSGGARHPFECYLAIQNTEGLQDGFYHYLPMTHGLELLAPAVDLRGFVSESLCAQNWACKANAVFYFSCVFYRAEWRYGIWAHAPILMDSGHITENLYLAATSIGLGGCAVAAVDPDVCNRRFGLDGAEETIFYAMPVGTIRKEDRPSEEAFYAFVRESGL